MRKKVNVCAEIGLWWKTVLQLDKYSNKSFGLLTHYFYIKPTRASVFVLPQFHRRFVEMRGWTAAGMALPACPVPLLTIINTDQWGREVAHCYCHPDFLPFWLLWLMLPPKLLRSVDLIVVKDWLILVKVGGVEGWGSHFDSGCCNIEMWLWLCKYRKILTRKWLVKVGGVKHLGHVEGLL